MTQPLVSVIVCVYNAGDYLLPSLQSVLAQTYGKIEVLIIDDGSTDGCVDAAQEELDDPRIRWFRQENAGKSAALNRALRELRGEFYAIHDADDLSYPSRIERLVEAMEAHPEVAGVFSGHDLVMGEKRLAPRFREKSARECRGDIEKMRMPAHDPTAMYRVEMVRDLEYEPSLRIGQGYDYLLRVGERFPLMVLGECLYSYRVNPKSVTKRDPQERQRFVHEVQRRACERRGNEAPMHRPNQWVRRDNNLAVDFMESVVDLRASGRHGHAVHTGLACIRLNPIDPHYYKALLYALLPSALRRRLRRSERSERSAQAGTLA